ncbi:iron-sulfur cluster assembly scaffold protein [Castellaniella sp.]|uniref:iron-sulfur cluster assembly scaffold protein n=1 Tax=Castellaniella sp. TaxID=1955812 RepID=UPI0035625089
MALMLYGPEVEKRYRNPQGVGSFDVADPDVGTALVGSPQVGQVLKLQLRVRDGRVAEARFRAYGCGALIATGALLAEKLPGLTLDQVRAIGSHDIVEALQLPQDKLHCALLALDALAAAVVDYGSKHTN